MTKFIACEDGTYVNIDMVIQINTMRGCNDDWEVGIWYIHGSDVEDVALVSGLSTHEKAQDWLDKFMEKHGLTLEPITPTRCF